MVPSSLMMLNALPLSPNGKVDRQALPSTDYSRPDLPQEYEAPETPIEVALACIRSELLRLNRIGRHDSFFELGGHSLLATQVISRVRRTFEVHLPLRTLFEAPTLSGLAERIEMGESGRDAGCAAAREAEP